MFVRFLCNVKTIVICKLPNVNVKEAILILIVGYAGTGVSFPDAYHSDVGNFVYNEYFDSQTIYVSAVIRTCDLQFRNASG